MSFFGKGTWQPNKWLYTFYRIFGLVFLVIGLVSLGMIILSYISPSKSVALPPDNIPLNCEQVDTQWCYNVVGGGRGCFLSKDECEYDQADSRANAQWLSVKNELKDTVYCDSITFINLQARCYLDLAQRLVEPAICDKIDNSEDKNKDLCYGTLGAITNNKTLCEKAQDKDYCNLEYTNAIKK